MKKLTGFWSFKKIILDDAWTRVPRDGICVKTFRFWLVTRKCLQTWSQTKVMLKRSSVHKRNVLTQLPSLRIPVQASAVLQE